MRNLGNSEGEGRRPRHGKYSWKMEQRLYEEVASLGVREPGGRCGSRRSCDSTVYVHSRALCFDNTLRHRKIDKQPIYVALVLNWYWSYLGSVRNEIRIWKKVNTTLLKCFHRTSRRYREGRCFVSNKVTTTIIPSKRKVSTETNNIN